MIETNTLMHVPSLSLGDSSSINDLVILTLTSTDLGRTQTEAF